MTKLSNMKGGNQTLADLDTILKASTTMPPLRRDVYLRSIRCAVKWIGRPAVQISTDPDDLRRHFATLAVKQPRVSRRTIANVSASVLAAAKAAARSL